MTKGYGIVLLDHIPLRLELSCELKAGEGDVIIRGPITQEFEHVFNRAVSCAFDLSDLGEYPTPLLVGRDIHLRLSLNGAGEIPVGGESYGALLALVLAAAFAGRTLSPTLAVTGCLEEAGIIARVEGCAQKRMAACSLGFKRMMLPASQLDMFHCGIDQIPIATVYEGWSTLRYA